jgi:carboxymethylenebutenolidase
MEAAQDLALTLNWSEVRRDVETVVLALRDTGRVGIVGFCLGGTVAYAMACRLQSIAATVTFYGGNVVNYLDETPKCALQLHFGQYDPYIPMKDVEEIQHKRPDADLYIYSAGHGFNCDERNEFEAESAAIAWGRTIEFLRRHVAIGTPYS